MHSLGARTQRFTCILMGRLFLLFNRMNVYVNKIPLLTRLGNAFDENFNLHFIHHSSSKAVIKREMELSFSCVFVIDTYNEKRSKHSVLSTLNDFLPGELIPHSLSSVCSTFIERVMRKGAIFLE